MRSLDVREPLLLHKLRQPENYESPFETDAPGFKNDWWKDGWRVAEQRFREAFVAIEHDQEVARAITIPGARLYCDQYVDLTPLSAPVEVFRFEVREHLQRSKIGRRMVEEIADHYSGRDLFAFGDADYFWRGIGWQEHPRTDGDRMVAPLFVLRQSSRR